MSMNGLWTRTLVRSSFRWRLMDVVVLGLLLIMIILLPVVWIRLLTVLLSSRFRSSVMSLLIGQLSTGLSWALLAPSWSRNLCNSGLLTGLSS